MNAYAAVANVASAILSGAVLMTPTHSVGRYVLATDNELRFACLTLQGSPVESPEVEEHAVSFYEKTTETRHDWSAFGAAKAFVDEVGTIGAERALRRLSDVADAEERRPAKPRAPRRMSFVWTVEQADRDGRPTLRTCRLDRIRWPGLAVWHERGVYELVGVDRRGTCFPTGLRFRSQRELRAYLETIRADERKAG